MNNVLCVGTEDAFKDCHFTIDAHDDPSEDVSVCCYPCMILTVSITVRTGFLLRVCSCRSLTTWTATIDAIIILLGISGVCGTCIMIA